MDSPYGQPLTDYQETPNSIVINQQSPAVMIHPGMFKTNAIALNCTFCHKPITTNVNKTFNCCACCLCYFTGILWYVCIQACRGKDICCYNATHTCPYCGNVVGTYQACWINKLRIKKWVYLISNNANWILLINNEIDFF